MTKIRIAKFAGIAAGAALAFGSFVPMAGAQTASQLQDQINALMAQLAAMQGTTVTTSYQFNTNLTVGSRGADVVALQQFLVSKGYLQMPAGVAFGYFGTLTKSAVARWQAASGIYPAVGYFGPISRAAIATQMGGTVVVVPGGTTCPAGYVCNPTNPVPPSTVTCPTGYTCTPAGGGTVIVGSEEGTLTVRLSAEGSGAELREGDDREVVMGLELEADESDIRIERIQIDLDTAGIGGDENFYRDIADTIYVMDGSTVLATRELNDDTTVEDSAGNRSITISGLNFIVREDTEEILTIALDALENIDSEDEGASVDIMVPIDGVRGVDGAGINVYDPDVLLTESFEVEGTTAGDLDLSEGNTNPDVARVVFIDEEEDTNDVLVLAFDLEADNQDINVDAIPVGFRTATSSVFNAASRAVLKMNGTVVDSKSFTVTTATNTAHLVFDDLDIDIEDGDTAEFTVHVDFNDADVSTFATGTTMFATTTATSAGWDVEDALGDNVVVDGGTVTGGTMTFHTEGILVTPVSTNAVSQTSDDTSWGTYTIVFDVKALGDDAYIRNGAASTTLSDAFGAYYTIKGTTWAGGTESSVITSTADLETNHYVVDENQTERFTLTVTLDPAAQGTYGLELSSIASDDSATAGGDTVTTIDPNDQRFETSLVFVPAT